jgi:hypothetical protein
MPAYILSYRGTKTLAGVYSADNLTRLGLLIDQETNPDDHEYAVIDESFGIEFRNNKGRMVDVTIGGADENLDAALAKAKHI